MSDQPVAPVRVLVVDDADNIHEDFRDVLEAPRLSGRGSSPRARAPLVIDSAFQGEEAVARVREATEHGQPYAVAFVDIRMPPGMDGVETTRKLWEVDPDLQVVLCTAYSDYDWHDLYLLLERPENFFILKKAFDPIEVRQLVYGLVQRRKRMRSSEARIAGLSKRVDTVQKAARRSAEICADFGRRTEVALARAEAEREHRLGDMAANVNHEINSPLTCIVTSLDLALGDLESLGCSADRISGLLKDAQHGASRIASVTAELRDRFCGTESPGTPSGSGTVLHIGPAPTGPRSPSGRVLVIDDDRATARSLKRSLRGHEVHVCHDPAEAVGLCTHEDYDVVLCDYTLGPVSGQHVYESVRELAPAVAARFIFVTGGATTRSANEFLTSGAVSVVYKPVHPSTLRSLVSDRVASRAAPREAQHG